MYKWRIDFLLKNGLKVHGVYTGPENDSGNVARRMFTGDLHTFYGIRSVDETRNMFVKIDEIVAFEIYPLKEKTND